MLAPHREPLRTTLLRGSIIALIGGAIVARSSAGRVSWPMASLLLLWLSFGGHWVELAYLNVIRPRLPATRPVQIAARVAVWIVGGTVLVLGMALTATAGGAVWDARWAEWWTGGLAFVVLELIVHLGLLLRGRPNFYNGRG